MDTYLFLGTPLVPSLQTPWRTNKLDDTFCQIVQMDFLSQIPDIVVYLFKTMNKANTFNRGRSRYFLFLKVVTFSRFGMWETTWRDYISIIHRLKIRTRHSQNRIGATKIFLRQKNEYFDIILRIGRINVFLCQEKFNQILAQARQCSGFSILGHQKDVLILSFSAGVCSRGVNSYVKKSISESTEINGNPSYWNGHW